MMSGRNIMCQRTLMSILVYIKIVEPEKKLKDFFQQKAHKTLSIATKVCAGLNKDAQIAVELFISFWFSFAERRS